MKYRPMAVGDLDGLMPLLQMMYDEGQYTALPWSRRVARGRALMLIAKDDMTLLGVWDDDTLVGFLGGVITEHLVYAGKKACREHFFNVMPEHRGRHVGKGLLDQLEAWAKMKGAYSLALDVSSGIETDKTVRLFGLFGYEQTGVLMEKEI